jgi:hypothetical protein
MRKTDSPETDDRNPESKAISLSIGGGSAGGSRRLGREVIRQPCGEPRVVVSGKVR